ncbi:hypothetical protein GR702_09345 [Novosphingobium sp. FGD1]|jgi:hypothetical protein|uniref:Uncharacterized protein n=1 Tax=Novosphingobium silvae TaxID=2692619 RepID=A0A7X4K7B3_9SPHN|nr:hypothetical protein [Novosphingobium silvae]MYL97975.1 hypothetical protein [Novosphingobium silvae]
MKRYRFVTPHRTGKWYSDLQTAQRHACEIGAGFLDGMTGKFVAYVETMLEVGNADDVTGPKDQALAA